MCLVQSCWRLDASGCDRGCNRRVGKLLTQPLPEPLAVAIGAQEPQRGARQHRAVQCLVPLPELRPFLPGEATSVLRRAQLLGEGTVVEVVKRLVVK
jgi:hypothetical protein